MQEKYNFFHLVEIFFKFLVIYQFRLIDAIANFVSFHGPLLFVSRVLVLNQKNFYKK